MDKYSKAKQRVIDIVKRLPGLSGRQVRKELGLGEASETAVQLRLQSLQNDGVLRAEEIRRGSQVYARAWYVVDTDKRKHRQP